MFVEKKINTKIQNVEHVVSLQSLFDLIISLSSTTYQVLNFFLFYQALQVFVLIQCYLGGLL